MSDSVEIRKLVLDVMTDNIRIRLDQMSDTPVCVHTEYRVVYIGGRPDPFKNMMVFPLILLRATLLNRYRAAGR